MDVERIAQISNDISEGIDNGESREELREAISYYSSELSHTYALYNTALERLKFIRLFSDTQEIREFEEKQKEKKSLT